jgi:glycosyltransferase involved in cell wall biosynthesis
MEHQAAPLVSVITPVYNGETYLSQCIESVLAQTYQNWEYVIVDNCSTDRSLEIAQRYAQQDGRIRVHRNQQFVSAFENHHIGFRQMAPQSGYCKVVHADDWLFTDCIGQMVEVGEAHPSVGIVSAYRLDDTWADLGGIPYPNTVVPGREICRQTLLQFAHVFGSPTSLLLRSGCIRRRERFYDEGHFPRHADTAACYEVLQEWDLGFVHQILTYTRRPDKALTSFNREVNSYLAEDLAMLMKYGPIYLDREDCEHYQRQWTKAYRWFLGRNMVQRRGKKFWDYHRAMQGSLGWPLSPARLLGALLLDATQAVASQVRAARRMIPFGRSLP